MNIRTVVESAHRELERHYALPARRRFKVNFMTRSFADGEITIAAWANKAERRPSSLQKRASDTHVYNTTKTAEVYRMEEPLPIIVDDTSRPEHSRNYVLDSHQRDRIRSHLVWPVLCPQHELLGTFVIDCTEAGFFRPEDEILWEDFCEGHARPLALEMLRLKSATVLTDAAEGPKSWARPPF
jgi:GAF domain-containing protein